MSLMDLDLVSISLWQVKRILKKPNRKMKVYAVSKRGVFELHHIDDIITYQQPGVIWCIEA